MAEVNINVPNFPSNDGSKPKATETTTEPEVQEKKKKIVTGTVTVKKKSFIDKFSETFFGDDAKHVANFVVYDVMVPAAKNMFIDAVNVGIERLFWGDKGAPSSSRRRDRYIPYNSISDRNRDRRDRFDRGRSDRDIDRREEEPLFEEIVIHDGSEAEEVLENLLDAIDQYKQVSVADYYDYLGLKTRFTQNRYGWKNLARTGIRRVAEGYIIDLPRPYEID